MAKFKEGSYDRIEEWKRGEVIFKDSLAEYLHYASLPQSKPIGIGVFRDQRYRELQAKIQRFIAASPEYRDKVKLMNHSNDPLNSVIFSLSPEIDKKRWKQALSKTVGDNFDIAFEKPMTKAQIEDVKGLLRNIVDTDRNNKTKK